MKYNYFAWFGYFLLMSMAGYGIFVVYYNMTNHLFLSVFIGCLLSALGSTIIPRLKEFKIKTK